MRTTLIAAMAVLGAGPVLAQDAPVGDAAAGETQFQRQCIACHVVQDEAGEVLAGRNAQVGPNLYGVVGSVAAGEEGFAYSEILEAYAATGAVWEEANTVAFMLHPTNYLREATGDSSGRSKMAYQVRDEQAAHDLYAFLATFATEAGAEDGAEDGAAAEGEAAPQ